MPSMLESRTNSTTAWHWCRTPCLAERSIFGLPVRHSVRFRLPRRLRRAVALGGLRPAGPAFPPPRRHGPRPLRQDRLHHRSRASSHRAARPCRPSGPPPRAASGGPFSRTSRTTRCRAFPSRSTWRPDGEPPLAAIHQPHQRVADRHRIRAQGRLAHRARLRLPSTSSTIRANGSSTSRCSTPATRTGRARPSRRAAAPTGPPSPAPGTRASQALDPAGPGRRGAGRQGERGLQGLSRRPAGRTRGRRDDAARAASSCRAISPARPRSPSRPSTCRPGQPIAPGSFAALMERRFEAYKTHVVRPFFRDHFQRIDRQIVLVDVLAAIDAGPLALAELEEALDRVLMAFRTGRNTLLSRLFSPARRPGAVRGDEGRSHPPYRPRPSRRDPAPPRRTAPRGARRPPARGSAPWRSPPCAPPGRPPMREGRETLSAVAGMPEAGERVGGEVFDGEAEAAIFPGELPETRGGRLPGRGAAGLAALPALPAAQAARRCGGPHGAAAAYPPRPRPRIPARGPPRMTRQPRAFRLDDPTSPAAPSSSRTSPSTPSRRPTARRADGRSAGARPGSASSSRPCRACCCSASASRSRT